MEGFSIFALVMLVLFFLVIFQGVKSVPQGMEFTLNVLVVTFVPYRRGLTSSSRLWTGSGNAST